jgi:hypothetical protein
MRPTLLRLLIPALCAFSAFAATATAAPAGPTVGPSSYGSLVNNLASAERQVLQSYIDKDSPSDQRYYRDGVWMDPSVDCWSCYSTAGTAAAVMSLEGAGDPALQAIAIRTFDRSIDEHQKADGGFAGGAAGSDGVITAFWAGELGITYNALAPHIDPATRARWATSLGRAADYLINAGHTTWYANGNLNLRYAAVLYSAWLATGEPRFKSAYDAEWAFVTAPNQTRWTGYGLQITRQPTTPDGSDGAGYLAEGSGGAPGYDPSYTQTQLDFATSLYVMSKDPRVLRLMNLEVNQLLPRVDSAFTLDATNGSRKNYITPFMTSALAVLVHTGTRPDLAGLMPGQFARTVSEFRGAMGYTHPVFYKDLSMSLSTVVIDARSDTADATMPAATPLPAAVRTATPSAPATTPQASPAPASVPARATPSTAARSAVAAPTAAGAPKTAFAPAVVAPKLNDVSSDRIAPWAMTVAPKRSAGLKVTIAGVKGRSTVTAEVFSSAKGAHAAVARPLRRVVKRETAANYTVRVPLARGSSRTVVLRLTIVDATGRRTVVRTVKR